MTGPLQSGMVDDFIDRKNGANVEHLSLNYGRIRQHMEYYYQEQVMKIAQVLPATV